MKPMLERPIPELRFLAAVALRFDTPLSVGEAPDGVRLDFRVQGTVAGPALKGSFPSCAAYLLIDVDGVGTINVRAPLTLDDGALLELEATGRYDFGPDGYRRAAAGDLSDSALGWCPRFFTGHPRYAWLNRALCLGVGELRPRETRVDYDLFLVTSPSSVTSRPMPTERRAPIAASLYQRLGGNRGIQAVVGDFVDALLGNAKLNQQNPKVAVAHARANLDVLKRRVTAVFCQLLGGPCEYRGRSLKAVHAPLDITEADWAIAAEELLSVLNKRRIPKAEQDELLAAIGATKSDIVARK